MTPTQRAIGALLFVAAGALALDALSWSARPGRAPVPQAVVYTPGAAAAATEAPIASDELPVTSGRGSPSPRRRAASAPACRLLPALAREYEPIAAWAKEEWPAFFAAGAPAPEPAGCPGAAARLAFAMNSRLPELGRRCGVAAWTTQGAALTWQGLSLVGEALERCGARALAGECPACP